MSVIDEIKRDQILTELSVVSVGNHRSLNFWSITNNKLLFSLEDAHKRFIHDIATIDAETMLTCGAETIKLWSISSMKTLKTFRGHKDTIRCIESMDSTTFLSGSDDCNIKYWNTLKEKAIHTFEGFHSNYVTDVKKVSRKKFVSGSFDGVVQMFDLPTQERISRRKFDGYVYCLDSNIPFRIFVAGTFGGKAVVMNKNFDVLFDLRADNSVSSVHIVQDKNYVLCGDIQGNIYCWDLRAQSQRLWKKERVHPDTSVEKIITLNEDFYCSAGSDGYVNIDSFNEFCDESVIDDYDELDNPNGVDPYARFQRSEYDSDGSDSEEEEFLVTDEGVVVVVNKKTKKKKKERETEILNIEEEFNPENQLGERISTSENLEIQSGIVKNDRQSSLTCLTQEDLQRMRFREKGPVKSICVMKKSHIEIFLRKNEMKQIAMEKYVKKKRREEEKDDEFC